MGSFPRNLNEVYEKVRDFKGKGKNICSTKRPKGAYRYILWL